MTSLLARIGPRAPVLLLCLVLATAIGATATRYPLVALGIAVMALAAGLTAVRPMIIPLLALPTLLLVTRVSAGGVDLSASDAALAAAFVPAAVLGIRPYSPPMRALLWLTIAYQAATLFTVIANPYPANAIEWVHAWFLTGGALVVGWGVGRAGLARTGIWLIFAAACLMSLTVVVQFVVNVSHGSFEAVYVEWPIGMHKNFTGTTLGIVAPVAYAAPAWLARNRRLTLAVFWWCALGVGLSQSRQAIVALAVVLAILVLRSEQDRRRSKLILLAAVPALWMVLTYVRDQLASGNEHNSAQQRLAWFEDALDIWATNPVWGVGLRWWYTGRFGSGFQPPNAEIEMLTSAGVLGLIGFLVLMIGAIVVLWRVGPTYGGVAALAILSRLIQGQFDLFWTAVQVSLAFAIAGVCLGAKDLSDKESSVVEDAERVGAGT